MCRLCVKLKKLDLGILTYYNLESFYYEISSCNNTNYIGKEVVIVIDDNPLSNYPYELSSSTRTNRTLELYLKDHELEIKIDGSVVVEMVRPPYVKLSLTLKRKEKIKR
jgi:hypothetical protein